MKSYIISLLEPVEKYDNLYSGMTKRNKSSHK
jgi:hypothetical protein